jgi:hypothetical protein
MHASITRTNSRSSRSAGELRRRPPRPRSDRHLTRTQLRLLKTAGEQRAATAGVTGAER